MSEIASELIGLEFAVHKSIRYRAKRRAFLNTLHRGTLAVVSLSGTATFVALIGDETTIAKWVALLPDVFDRVQLWRSGW